MKVKRQHYVPVCYLKKFAIDNKLHIYDKKLNEYRRNQSPMNIACINSFYDLCEDEIKSLNIESRINGDEQYIEHFFSSEIEGKLSFMIDHLNKTVPEKCDSFSIKLDKSIKELIAEQISYQLIRTIGFRDGIRLAYPEKNDKEVIELHKKVILSENILKKNKELLLSLNWDIGYDMKGRFLTSDDPVIFHKFRGYPDDYVIIQFIYPLSPKLLITITNDLIKNKKIEISEARIFNDDNLLHLMNSKQLENANRFIIIPNNNEIDSYIFEILNGKTISKEMKERLNILVTKQIEMINSGNINDENTKQTRAELEEIMNKIRNET